MCIKLYYNVIQFIFGVLRGDCATLSHMDYKKIFVTASAAFMVTSSVFAAGGGGGGSATNVAPAPWRLKCFNKPTLRARIDCRLALKHEELEKEISAKYLPEECRAKPEKQQAECVQLYKDLGPCGEQFDIDSRMSCARDVIGMSSSSIIDLYRECKDLKTASIEKEDCLAAQREKLYTYSKFKFYDLSKYAEEYLEKGQVTRRMAVDFVTLMETKKQQFNKAGGNIARRIAIVKEVRTAWAAFIKKVKRADKAVLGAIQTGMDDQLKKVVEELIDVK